jgi:bifunctional DNase/RNase
VTKTLGRAGTLLLMVALGACMKKKAPETSTPAAPSASATNLAPAAALKGYVAARVAGVTHVPTGGEVVLLVQDGTKRALPIFIGGTEALSIQLRLEKKAYKRPLTHDLFDSSVAKLGGRVESVRVDKIDDGIFYGTVVLVNGQSRFELDARPSDAIALAVGNQAPIQVAVSVFDHAGVDLEKVPGEIERRSEPGAEKPEPISL